MLEKMKKYILDPSDPDPGQCQNLFDWYLTEVLSFHIIWFKSVSNFLRYPANRHTISKQTNEQTDGQTDARYHSHSATSLAEVTII